MEKGNTKSPTNINKLQSKIERLNELYIDGRISKEKYELEYEKVNLQINEFSTKKEKRNYSSLKKILNTNITSVYNKLSNISKRNFWAEFIDYIIIKENGEYDIHFK